MASLPRINTGERASIAGRTGSGKTVGATWLLSRSPGYWLVLDRKYDKLLGSIGKQVTMNDNYLREFDKSRILIVRPKTGDPDELDAWINFVHEEYENVGLFVDELYYIHNQGRPGPGLTGWLTRGRSRGQSFIGCTQRPAWVSRFVFSESDYIAGFALNLADDRKKMMEFTGQPAMLEKLPKQYWRWYSVADDELTTYGPVPFAGLKERFPMNK